MPLSAIMAYSVRVFSNVAIAQLSHEVADLLCGQVERRSGGGIPAEGRSKKREFRISRSHRNSRLDGGLTYRSSRVLLARFPVETTPRAGCLLMKSSPIGQSRYGARQRRGLSSPRLFQKQPSQCYFVCSSSHSVLSGTSFRWRHHHH